MPCRASSSASAARSPSAAIRSTKTASDSTDVEVVRVAEPVTIRSPDEGHDRIGNVPGCSARVGNKEHTTPRPVTAWTLAEHGAGDRRHITSTRNRIIKHLNLEVEKLEERLATWQGSTGTLRVQHGADRGGDRRARPAGGVRSSPAAGEVVPRLRQITVRFEVEEDFVPAL